MACLRSSLSLTNKSKCLIVISGNSRNFSTSNSKCSVNETGLSKKEIEALATSSGTGGRSSVSGNTVTVFGATGMMGRILCNRLGKDGSQIIVPFRGDPHDLRPLRLCSDLGQMYFQVSIKFPNHIFSNSLFKI